MGTRGRNGFWFPLVLLGFLTLGGIAAATEYTWLGVRHYVATPNVGADSEWFSYQPTQGLPSLSGGQPALVPSVPEEYWLIGLLLVLQATIVWYAWKSDRARFFALIGLGGAAAACVPLGFAEFLLNSLSLRPHQFTIVAGLILLAWFERSVLLAVVASAYLAATWLFDPGMTGLALTAAVLFVGALLALVLRGRHSPDPEPA